jgi:hypothetical protein
MNVQEILYEAIENGWKVSKNENKINSYVFEKSNITNKKLVKDLEDLYLYGSTKKRKNSKKINFGKDAKN